MQHCNSQATILVEQNFLAISPGEALFGTSSLKIVNDEFLWSTNPSSRNMNNKLLNTAFNDNMPEDSDTYLHNVAGADSCGIRDLTITFVSDENDSKLLNNVHYHLEISISDLPDELGIPYYTET